MSNKPLDGQETPVETLKRATAACVRALSGRSELLVSYAPVNAPGITPAAGIFHDQVRLPLPSSPTSDNPGNRARLRGIADAIALKLRHHDPSVHARRMPQGQDARSVYNALEQARVEALGATRLPGTALNLAAATEARLSAEELCSVTDPGSIAMADLVHAALHRHLGIVPSGTSEQYILDLCTESLGSLEKWLDILKNSVTDQKQYAATIRKLLDDLGIEADDNSDQEEDGASLEPDTQDKNQQSSTDQGADAQNPDSTAEDTGDQTSDSLETGDTTPAEQKTETETESSGASLLEEEMSAPSQTHPPGPGHNRPAEGKYHVYTTEFDQIRSADELCDPEELARLRFQLDQQLNHLRGVVARLANRLQRRLMAQQLREWDFDLEDGILDSARLARVVANPALSLSYKQERDAAFRDTVVTLLIDNSGSMRGRPITVAAMSADILARTLERCGVKVEILGFTTSQWKGGKAREAWTQDGKPANPGRLNDIRHIIYKSADTPWRRARRNLGLMLKEGILKENIDGEALLWAHQRLIGRPEQRRILMVISDGAPVDDSTLSANPGTYLEQHLRSVITWIESRSPVDLLAIGIGHDVTRYYRRAITLMDAEELGGAVLKQVSALFDTSQQGERRHHAGKRRRP
ncbi:cobaltochelatase subunit CobT [Haematospirillum sp. H1815]|uniref:cobaltochelatase CobT-related protein n=1 Tax=Haematospirillum sp. H1815 TaxID=2723108 RepID=UPI0014388E20|nr:cobaltochelatase subunit CobT [Haematospirillum sp. H1815]NKD78036.1 cobaltochelatase subunit CobT [Haematospirillum sp. H1815]